MNSIDATPSIGMRSRWLWFATGMWIGFIISGAVEKLLRDPQPEPATRDLPFGWLVLVSVPGSVLLSLIFLAWISARLYVSGSPCRVQWNIALLLGCVYFPLLMAAIPVLIWLTGEGQGVHIGSSIGAFMFGLPILLGEIAFRLGQRGSGPA